MIALSRHGCFLAVAAAAVLCLASCGAVASPLPRLNIDIDAITVAGISAGGAFASQFHVAHSASLAGAAIFAGPPFFCSQANVDIAVTSCMKTPDLIDVDALAAEAVNAALINSIDDTRHMRDAKVWLFTGKKDTVVHPGVVEKTKAFYEHFVNSSSNIKMHDTFPAEHAWITSGYGEMCDFLGDPYINNCSFDAVGDFLNHLYDGKIKPSGSFNAKHLLRFEQAQYIESGNPEAISFGNAGFVYVPKQCASGTQCRLVVTFHGCNQDVDTIGEEFVIHNGLNEYAETNNLVILYPQVEKSAVIPYNPKGCFDWWGYAGINFATKGGAQIRAVATMIHAITGQFGANPTRTRFHPLP
ncbi:hypothetical protein PTSG_09595 [Salpingoeca rosetta]|uniref:Polyhydroxybutyrate depolymerase n=1 Tax=Salpingoeca rosetta (strain ATCC 50818 / BSB-021) TaxID=946362 RepID=F2ULG2_SALR5|nr:uncharacterized protein PTSG_09595 [Salpingoeca rosetta]EGD77961.1 hypothetical protein PTSG_09595 [Salpingoeca rosetta]|eukprot:XP_004990024.1 hypothetical protein PTSG_09595 [Salpingoeca rosetta]